MLNAVLAVTQIWVRIPLVYPHVMLEEAKVEGKYDMLPGAGFGAGTGMGHGAGAAAGGGAEEAAARDAASEIESAARAGASELPAIVQSCAAPAALGTALQRRSRDDPWEVRGPPGINSLAVHRCAPAGSSLALDGCGVAPFVSSCAVRGLACHG